MPAGEEGLKGPPRSDSARRAREAARSEGRGGTASRGGDERAGRQSEVPGRHDDRGAAGGDDRRQIAARRSFSRSAPTLTQMTSASPATTSASASASTRTRRFDKDPFATSSRRRRAGAADGRRARRRARPDRNRHLRRARRRPGLREVLPQDRAQLRELFALPRAGGASCCRAGGAGGQGWRLIGFNLRSPERRYDARGHNRPCMAESGIEGHDLG